MSFASRALVAMLVSASALSSVNAAEIAVSSVTASSTF
jgi:hypothetical protein